MQYTCMPATSTKYDGSPLIKPEGNQGVGRISVEALFLKT